MLPDVTASYGSSSDDSAWYAVWTRARHEQAVRQQLQQKQIEIFLPTMTRWSRWKDRRKKVEWPLFPGYCFARFNGRDTRPILTCTGVLSIVSFDGKPMPIEDIEVESLRRVVETTLAYDPCPLIREGTLVEVVSGPLRGVIGRLLRKDAGRATLVLSVNLINQAVRVEISAADVRPH